MDIYDAELGRFLQADPFVNDRTNLQALNRYSYVENNPLSYTDPSGYFLKKLFKKFRNFVKKVFRAIRKGIQSIFKAIGRVLAEVPLLSTVVAVFVCNVNVACWAIYGKIMAGISAAVTMANGGTILDAARGFAIGYVSSNIGGATGGALQGTLGEATSSYVGAFLSGGIASKASGGKFIDGIKGAAIGLAVRHVALGIREALTQGGEQSGTNLEPSEANMALSDNEIIELAIDLDVKPTQAQLDKLAEYISTNPEKAVEYAAKIWGIKLDRIGDGIIVVDDGGGPSYNATPGGGRITFRSRSFGDPEMGPGALGSQLFHEVLHDVLPGEQFPLELNLRAHIRILRLEQSLESHFNPNARYRSGTARGIEGYQQFLKRLNE